MVGRHLSQVLCLFLLVVAIVFPSPSSANKWLADGVWDVATLLPGHNPVPPRVVLSCSEHAITIEPRVVSRLENAVQKVAASLHIIRAEVPNEERDVCHWPADLSNISIRIAVVEDQVEVQCNPSLFTGLSLQQWVTGNVAVSRFESPLPLRGSRADECVELPWQLVKWSAHRLEHDRVVVAALLHDRERDTEPCWARFEALLHEKPAQRSGTSTVTTATMLLVVIAMRIVPRYVLKKTGQINANSYRGKRPGTITAQERRDLLRQQAEIIEKMKAEDRAKKAS